MQQYKLIPCLATAFAMFFAHDALKEIFARYYKALEGGQDQAFEILENLHGITTGMKSYSTWQGAIFGELMKQAGGGHGFLNVSGLPRMVLDSAIGFCTAEGDNTILLF